MSGYVVVLLVNAALYILVRVYSDAGIFRRFGHHRALEVLAFGLFCITFYMYGILNGAIREAADYVPGQLQISSSIFAFGILTGVPWVVKYGVLVVDTSSGVVDTIYGLNRELLDTANLKVAHEHLKKGERREAIGELTYLREKYPDAHSPLFLLAILAEEDKDIDKAIEIYREIVFRHEDNVLIWTNAASNLAELLRRELNDMSAAKHLEEKIRKRNPDTEYKLTSSRKPAKKKKLNKKKRNIPLEKADMNQARRLVTRGELPSAIALMKRHVSENPEDSRSQFELISLFERVERIDDAIIWSQKMIHTFGDNDQVWGDAMMRLAGLREHGENDLDAAVGLLEQVASRLKHAKHGRLAREHLKDVRSRGD